MRKNMKNSIYAVTLLLAAITVACKSDDGGNSGGQPYDPGKPIVFDSFYPDVGGMATKVILSGSNFGTNLSAIEVYFNDKPASVISANGNKIYVVTPRQPGDECDITVVIDGKSVTCESQKFTYNTMVTVTTIVGQKGTSEFKGGTLAEATFIHPAFLCVDNENNIFLSHWDNSYGGNFVIISQDKDYVAELANTGATNVPAPDADGKVILVPTDGGYNYYAFDPDAQWASKRMAILRPTQEEIDAGKVDFQINYKHGFAANELDGMMYVRAHDGQLIRFDPLTRKGEKIADLGMSNDTYLMFHPVQKNLLFLTYCKSNVIYTYDLNTGKHELYAGSLGLAGWRDGDRLQAEFNWPRQMVFDEEGAIVLADENNHCIRKITPDGMVTTIVGIGGKAGYQDGNPDDALFYNPRGVCIDKDYNIYIADYNNNCIRRLAIE